MTTQTQARQAFHELVARPDEEIELDRGALLLAAEEYPRLEIDAYLAQLDQFAARVRTQAEAAGDLATRVAILRAVLADELGFRGNTENYYDARNSFLNDVIERRTGIPITLSVVYLEVARRVGLKLLGVAMPGHFLVKVAEGEGELLIDPFNGGRVLTEEDCQTLLGRLYGPAARLQPEMLRAATKRQILARMLQNLKGIYARAGDHYKTLGVIERALALATQDNVATLDRALQIRDRGLVRLGLQHYAQALQDLEQYLRMQPEARDAGEIQEKIKHVRQLQARLN